MQAKPQSMQIERIQIERHPSEQRLNELGVRHWPTWSKAPSEFPWVYDDSETCFFLSGDVEVTPDGGETVRVGQGDLVIFPAGMSCRWRILQSVKKHYSFG
jgi:uncharacterized cupin superfamily protein